jgi:uncharacterized cupin superfamily protein
LDAAIGVAVALYAPRVAEEWGDNVLGELAEIGDGVRGERLVIVLSGTATLRTPEGQRALPAGSVAHFPTGPEGAHTVLNRGEEPVRYVMVAAHATPDIVEYPDEGTFAAMAKTPSQRGDEQFFVRLPLPE